MRTGLVVVSSTRASQGVYEDTSGPVAVDFLRAQGFDTPEALVVSDHDLPATIDEIFTRAELPSVLLTSGGTGLSPDDRTVEIVSPYIEREIPGLVHAFWQEGLKNTPMAVVSRALAGTRGRTFVMTLPGSRGGVKDGCAVLAPVLNHIIDSLEGHHGH
ncbi:MogA/MoaB family molybdenum cofactor biosynthesis protein [Corynebacterium breve]|uniref:MogA/MoaB family molybdenum cofactor biosynthesis protein n=1 Tax=Corynebacterium breve TaxID=3049799 RepID=A0ABY8VGW1_9CORY|nr:MogA/MoaB family molybdenum cofactor biosynthesis protein [Corynebacterium breve]WIM67883.1 MogA/MoaB family molybdenum cofactor biosynthesis protein [Corynebacterium breve]